MASILAAGDNAPLRVFGLSIAAYVEPHIEQASVLERAGVPVGVVTGIQGSRRYRVRVLGEAAHAGTAVSRDRRDALCDRCSIMRFGRGNPMEDASCFSKLNRSIRV